MIATFHVPWELPTLNQYIARERGNRYAAAAMKRKATELVAYSIREQCPGVVFTAPVTLDVLYTAPNRRTDRDNIAFMKKFLLDGMVKAGMIADDKWQYVMGWDEKFRVSKAEAGISVTVKTEAGAS